MTSSSGSMPPPYSAVLRKGEEEVGPIRLPEENVARFVEHFDLIYRRVGMTISPTMIVRADPTIVSQQDNR